MKLKDFQTLKKLMQRTTSENDSEALTAIRMANAILAKEGVGWERVFDRLVTVVSEVEAMPADQEADDRCAGKEIDEAFETIEESDPRGDFADFIASLRSQWDRSRRLSPKQVGALLEARDKVFQRRRR